MYMFPPSGPYSRSEVCKNKNFVEILKTTPYYEEKIDINQDIVEKWIYYIINEI